jgi:hypothetical protein
MESLTLKINASGLDENELDKITSQIQKEIAELDVGSIERVNYDGPPPDGARVFDMASLDTFTVELAVSLITPVIISAWSWLQAKKQQSNGDTLKLEIIKGGKKIHHLDRPARE